MKTKRKIILTVLLALIIISTGCTNKGKTSYLERGYVIMGMDDTFAPMGFRDENGDLAGFDVDLAKEVFKILDVEVQFQAIDWSMKETELNNDNIDLIWNGYSITDERKEKVAFSKPYLSNKQIIITLNDSDIESKKDLEGKKVAVQNGSSTLDAINKEPDIVDTFDSREPILFDTNHEALLDLEAKRSDAVVSDEVLARYYIKEKGQENYKVLNDDFGEEEYGIGIKKENTELLEEINKALDILKDNGTYDKIYNKWFN